MSFRANANLKTRILHIFSSFSQLFFEFMIVKKIDYPFIKSIKNVGFCNNIAFEKYLHGDCMSKHLEMTAMLERYLKLSELTPLQLNHKFILYNDTHKYCE